MSSERKLPVERTAFKHFLIIPTRWMDNDVYGHVNNAVYYSYFDTVINRYLIEEGGLDFRNGMVVGIAIETMCRFHSSFAYPDVIEAGLGVGRLGNSSVRYEVGLFGPGEHSARAEGPLRSRFRRSRQHAPCAYSGPGAAGLGQAQNMSNLCDCRSTDRCRPCHFRATHPANRPAALLHRSTTARPFL